MTPRRPGRRAPADAIVARLDAHPRGRPGGDTVPTGFVSIDKALGGGLRRGDLVVLGGDVGSGKSALALGIALRVTAAGTPVGFLSGEMEQERLLERALAIEGGVALDDLRAATTRPEERTGIGAAAIRLRGLRLAVLPLAAAHLGEALDRLDEAADTGLVVVDYLQLAPPPAGSVRAAQDEDVALVLRDLKAFALARRVACLVVTQLPRFERSRPDRRPSLEDYGHLGSVKQHADVVLSVYREEMYTPGAGVEGATELIVSKNRNGPTGFVDLYFHKRWMRFEDILDPDR
ncbi:MAG TPA: DnaB-like helicase C-terminal domain-containing protein [Gemmatimonadales bacterium]|nr:DnaB-like helicase C-terminal domain-containing protein [Gemmatimonadales bacterium]